MLNEKYNLTHADRDARAVWTRIRASYPRGGEKEKEDRNDEYVCGE